MVWNMFRVILISFFCLYQTCSQETDSALAEQLYMRLFKRQRAEQLDAIKSFRQITNFEKQVQMIDLMAEKVFTVIQESRATIEASPYIPGVSDFPLDEKIRDSLSSILENTALFSEIILRYPDISVSVLRTNNNWDVLLQWSIAFCNQVRYLLDKPTKKLLHLVSQELNYIDKDPEYRNPYRNEFTKNHPKDEREEEKKKRKKKKEIKRGPRMSHNEF